jgi:uncharacterized protein with HEPN domain
MNERDKGFLLDIRESAKLALAYVHGKSLEDFLSDSQLQDAVIRRLEIIGEAARRVSEQTRSDLPNLPWTDMAGMRNLLIHGYGENRLWSCIPTYLHYHAYRPAR